MNIIYKITSFDVSITQIVISMLYWLHIGCRPAIACRISLAIYIIRG